MGGGADGRRPFSFAVWLTLFHCIDMDELDSEFEPEPEPSVHQQLLTARKDILRQLEVLEGPPGWGGSARQRQIATDELNVTLREIEDAIAGLDNEDV